MKLTNTLLHAKRFWWGKGWGPKPRVNTDQFYWRRQWRAKRRREVEVIPQTLPEGAVPIDPNVYVRQKLNEEYSVDLPEQIKFPWPYSQRPVKNSPDDPAYKPAVLVYQRHKRLLEPINFPLHFTNTILEEGVPERIQHFQEQVSINETLLENAGHRINWCLNNDAAMRKLPLRREFPYLDQRPPRVYGTVDNRKESNLLLTLHELAREYSSKQFGVNSDVVIQRIKDLNCVVPLERDGKDILLDLRCEFVTLLQNIRSQTNITIPSFASKNTTTNTPPKVASIHPLSWETGFNTKNFYTDDTEFSIPKDSSVQTIYLTNNNMRVLPDSDYQGRAIMYCYGYAVQQARLRSGKQNIEEIKLDAPINIQCIFSSPKSFVVGSVLFELNSLNPHSETELNRAWLLPVQSVEKDTEAVLKNVIALNSNGVHF